MLPRRANQLIGNMYYDAQQIIEEESREETTSGMFTPSRVNDPNNLS